MPKVVYTPTKGLVQESGSGIVIEKVNGTFSGASVTANGDAGILTTETLTTLAGASSAVLTFMNNRILETSKIYLTAHMGASQTIGGVAVAGVFNKAAGGAALHVYNIKGAGNALDDVVHIHYLIVN